MKLIKLSIFFLILALFLGCKKESIGSTDANSYWIKYKKNGVEESLASYISYCYNRPKAGDPTLTELIIGGESKDKNVVFYISIEKNSNFTTGTYQTGDAGTTFIVDYMVKPGQLDELDFALDNPVGYPTGYFTVSISSINGKEIKGTFSGNFLFEFFTHETISITDGEFFIKTH